MPLPRSQQTATQERVKVQILTKKLIPAIIFMYQSEDPKIINSALELSGYIMESYDDIGEMKHDIFESFVGSKGIVKAMQLDCERRFPIECKSLRNIFGEFLFGG